MVMVESSRREAFPAGLRVLVVDDDPTWLKILEKMLKKCGYEVATCGLVREALKLLRDRKNGFDIVISDVNMPDMDGFKLLEHVGLEMDLPVIMMSVDGETSRVMKGVQHGACDYLLKPIRMKELKNIWQHVVRKRMHEVNDIECLDERNGSDSFNSGHYSGDQFLFRKRKDVDNKRDDKETNDPSMKRARVVWTVELHQKFVKAVDQIGIDSDKVGPKKILDMMNVPQLTRENVASHLQKYRLYLSRIRNEDKTESSFTKMKNSEYSTKESSESLSLQNSIFGQQNEVSSDNVFPGNHLSVEGTDSKPLDTDLKTANLTSSTEQKMSLISKSSDSHEASSLQVGPIQDFGPLETGINYASFGSSFSGRYRWTAEEPEVQFEHEFNPHPSLDSCFKQPALPILQTDLLEPAQHTNSLPSISGSDLVDIKPMNVKPSGDDTGLISPIEGMLESFSVLNPETLECVFNMPMDVNNRNPSPGSISITEQVPFERSIHWRGPPSDQQNLDPSFNMPFDPKNQASNECSITNQGQSSICGLDFEQRHQLLGSESALGFLGDNVMLYWLHGGDGIPNNINFDSLALSNINFPEHINEAPEPKFGPDCSPYPFDCVEHPNDQSLLFAKRGYII